MPISNVDFRFPGVLNSKEMLCCRGDTSSRVEPDQWRSVQRRSIWGREGSAWAHCHATDEERTKGRGWSHRRGRSSFQRGAVARL